MAVNEIQLTPDFANMFRQFHRDALNNGMHLPESIEGLLLPAGDPARVLRIVQGVIAPLCIALQAATSVAEIEQLRSTFADILAHLNQKAAEMESEGESE